MPRLRIALAQINSTVGDLEGNSAAIIEWTRRAADRGAHLVVFPEMMLTGYPVEDLALRASFIDASIDALSVTAAGLADQGLGGVAVVTGYLGRHVGPPPRYGQPAEGALDAAALLHGGRVLVTSAKHHLPNYGVFDEYRYFLPGDRLPVFRLPCGEPGQAEPAVDVATAVCEDLWQEGGPVPSPGGPGPGCWSSPMPPPTSARRPTRGWSCASAAPARQAPRWPTST